MRRFVFVTFIGSFALIATVGVALDYFERPPSLRVAVPRDSDDQAILAAATRSFAESREAIRLKLVTVGDLGQSAQALEEKVGPILPWCAAIWQCPRVARRF